MSTPLQQLKRRLRDRRRRLRDPHHNHVRKYPTHGMSTRRYVAEYEALNMLEARLKPVGYVDIHGRAL